MNDIVYLLQEETKFMGIIPHYVYNKAHFCSWL